MAFDLRLPNITGSTEREQLAQVKSYLYQLTEQLQWAINNVSAAPASYVVSQGHISAPSSQSTPFDAEVAFSDLKPLIIKSADIVQAYYEEINNRLEGLFVAESDFGTFKQATERNIKETSEYSEALYNNIQEIITNIESLNSALIEVNAHIRLGLLYYDEDDIPIYGLEIGQRNKVDGEEVFNKFARFTSDRLSFYDQNDTEVAYISDFKLYITNAEITGKLKLGAFQIDTTKGFNLKYVGRG